MPLFSRSCPASNLPGTIEIHELQQVMRKLGQNPSEDELKEMISTVDDNGDCEIDFGEFLLLMKSRIGERDPEKELRDAFAVFDTDGSGSIDRKELKRLMKKLGQTLSEGELVRNQSSRLHFTSLSFPGRDDGRGGCKWRRRNQL